MKKNKKTSARVAGRGDYPLGLTSQPPRRNVACVFNHVFRFICTQAFQQTGFTRSALLNLMNINVSGSTGNWRLIQAIRLNRFEIWDPSNGVGTPGISAGLVWIGTQSQHNVYDDTSVGTAVAAHVDTKPPRDSTAYFVSQSGVAESETLFSLTCGQGSVLDLHCTVTIGSDYGSGVGYTTSNAGVGGHIYFNALDQTGGKLVPATELATLI